MLWNLDLPGWSAWPQGLGARLSGFGTEAFLSYFSSLQSSFEREILVRTNTFFIFFGTEALKAKILVHERQHLPGNLVSWGTRMCSKQASVPQTFLGTGWQLTLLNLDIFQYVDQVWLKAADIRFALISVQGPLIAYFWFSSLHLHLFDSFKCRSEKCELTITFFRRR